MTSGDFGGQDRPRSTVRAAQNSLSWKRAFNTYCNCLQTNTKFLFPPPLPLDSSLPPAVMTQYTCRHRHVTCTVSLSSAQKVNITHTHFPSYRCVYINVLVSVQQNKFYWNRRTRRHVKTVIRSRAQYVYVTETIP